jgi:hypothetical protein
LDEEPPFVGRAGLHAVSQSTLGREPAFEEVEVEVKLDDGWARGLLQERRRFGRQWEARVRYVTDGPGRDQVEVGERWFSSRRIRPRRDG